MVGIPLVIHALYFMHLFAIFPTGDSEAANRRL